MPCNNEHVRSLNESELSNSTHHQIQEHGRHKCCQCAYNQGYEQDFQLIENVTLDINALGDTQARSDCRHKSVHQVFALGYSNGIRNLINHNCV